jgi:hypothetical protein
MPGARIETLVRIAAFEDLADHDRAVQAGIFRDLPRRRPQCAPHNVDAGLLLVVLRFELGKRLAGVKQRGAAAGGLNLK